jgi:hypothetical protein
MKLVTFAESMAPYSAGEKCLVPDTVAEQLDSDNKLSAIEAWPVEDHAAQKPERKLLRPARAIGSPDKRIAR